nr:methyl-accepting chemotaxis protein [Azohydromonas aeria]
MTVRSKLTLGFSLLAFLVIVLAAFAIRALSKEHDGFEHYTAQVAVRLALVDEIQGAANARAISARNLVLVTSASDRDSEKAAVTQAHDQVLAAMKQLKAMLDKAEGVSEQERSLFKDIEVTESRYGPLALSIVALALDNRRDEAIAKMNSECRPLLATLVRQVSAYNKQVDVQASSEVRAAASTYETSRNLLLGGCVLAAALALGLTFTITPSITRALGGEPTQAADVARKIAQGNLTAEVPCRAGDTTSLMAAMKAMRDKLAHTVGEVRRNAEGVATASAQIAQGNQDLSQRTEQQASALQETASAMEELASTVRHNADNASQADQLAQGASAVAMSGGGVVSQVVDTMRGIEESSKRIADIIGTIDGIAFQTNILALNAAVEAARAGEQGRGFAVVAGEVRALAQRSAEAAKEIKTLIGDSVQRVEQGSALADQAGQTMKEVVTSVQRVTDLMGEINSASAEQSKGVAQVGEAVTQMDQATQQNAALVEESAAAADSLKTQAQRLLEAVSVFRTEPAGAATATSSWSGQERRGPDRARNVVRPNFSAHAAKAPVQATTRTGTDDWEQF